jgi:hypothetical protein
MATFLQSLFEDKAIVDNREPLLTFSIPRVEGTFGLFAPETTAWKQLAIVSASLGSVVNNNSIVFSIDISLFVASDANSLC